MEGQDDGEEHLVQDQEQGEFRRQNETIPGKVQIETTTVVFVPSTKDGKLATMLKEKIKSTK